VRCGDVGHRHGAVERMDIHVERHERFLS
jgi:hypothetical protein